MISAVTPSVKFEDRIYAITLDFGYCFSGYALSSTFAEQGRGVHYISKNQEYEKEPTCIIYTKHGSRFKATLYGTKALDFSKRAGSSEGRDYLFIDNVKERLDSVVGAKSSCPNREDEDDTPPLLQILCDYLTHLKNSALTDAFKVYGSNFDDSLVQWVISVPTHWNHDQKHILRQACFESGITDLPSSDTLILCQEPEAALIGLSESGEVDLKVGDLVTVCDCGGTRTVITSYKILSGLSYCPLGKSTIVNIGSESIDQELYARFKSHVGEEVLQKWVQEIPQLPLRILKQFKVLKQFFSLKRNSEASKKIRIHNEDIVLFTLSEAKEIMNDVIEGILTTVEKHMEKYGGKPNMKFISVGGFSKSQHFSKKMGEKMALLGYESVLFPREPSRAILDGMTMLATKPYGIRDRASRFSYGTQFSKIFDAKTDDPTAYRWGSPPNQFIASFLPFTQAGKYIPPDRVFEQIVCPANDHQTEFPFGLYYSMEQNPKLSACTELITLTVAIPEAYRHLGRENRFRILMTFGITEIKFSVIHTQSSERHETIVVL